MLQLLLELGLSVQSSTADSGYVVRVTGGKTPAVGVGDTPLAALQRASWRWLQPQFAGGLSATRFPTPLCGDPAFVAQQS